MIEITTCNVAIKWKAYIFGNIIYYQCRNNQPRIQKSGVEVTWTLWLRLYSFSNTQTFKGLYRQSDSTVYVFIYNISVGRTVYISYTDLKGMFQNQLVQVFFWRDKIVHVAQIVTINGCAAHIIIRNIIKQQIQILKSI